MKLKQLFCVFLALLMLTGCAVPLGGQNLFATEGTTVPTLPPVELEAVNTLSFRASTESPDIHVIDNRTVAILVPEFVPGASGTCTRATVLDLYTDTVLAEELLEGTLSPLPCSTGTTIALAEADTKMIYLLDRQLQPVTQFRADSVSGVVTGDLKYYYYVYGSALYSLDIAEEWVEEIALDWPLPLEAITGYDPTENLLLVDAYSDPYATAPCVAAIDLDTMTYCLVSDDATAAGLTRSGALLRTAQTEKMTADVAWFSWTGTTQYALPELLTNSNDYSTTHIPGSDYIFQICYDAKQNSNIKDVRLLQLGDALYTASLQEYLKGKKLNDFASLPDGNLLALAVTRRGYQPFVICPEKLTFTTEKTPDLADVVLLEEEIRSSYLLALQGGDLPGPLKQCREKADRLEETYDVTILLSSQCLAPASVSDVDIVTSDREGYDNEAERIRNALEELEDVLARYPEGFFRQFRNEDGERGILFLLVGSIRGEIDAAGVSYRLGPWYPIAVDITYYNLESTYYHEIWHATEFKITEERPDLLTDLQWSQWNPQGFSYLGHRQRTAEEINEFTLLGDGTDAGSYFIDSYAKTNTHEDRARLMEYTMTSDRYARLIMKKPALRSKLSAMVEAIREVFDTTGWEDIPWERYF